ncbi:MAG: acyl-CoA dehydratase activase [Syntrophales bacterium]|nr:acyl-CoA dehydratase activase [Syntrophales bacterium]
MYTMGIDVGSITTKAALIKDETVLGTKVVFTGYKVESAVQRVMNELLGSLDVKLQDVQAIWATGYGRKSVSIAEKTITEIMGHAAGAYFFDPTVRTVIDIGGQDSKGISVDEKGRVVNFIMNDKCAAGTGRFLEVMARALEVDLEQFEEMSFQSNRPAKISSLCTVFAESEIISLITTGEKRENIIAGLHQSIALRVASMLSRLEIKEKVLMSGGVAKNRGVVKALEQVLGVPIITSEYAQELGAIGAAILAARGSS